MVNRKEIIEHLVNSEMEMVQTLDFNELIKYIELVLTQILDNATDEELEKLNREVTNGYEL